jgi:cob(I)alamin adenosyltransferase
VIFSYKKGGNEMDLFSYNYGGKKLSFRMSNAAMMEIEQLQKQNLKTINPDLFKIAIEVSEKEPEKELGKENEQSNDSSVDILKQMVEILPYVDDFERLDKFITPHDLMYILLHNNPEYRELTKDEWSNIVWDMEENLGFEEVSARFEEVYEKVFTLMAKMKSPKKPKSKRTSKASMQA